MNLTWLFAAGIIAVFAFLGYQLYKRYRKP